MWACKKNYLYLVISLSLMQSSFLRCALSPEKFERLQKEGIIVDISDDESVPVDEQPVQQDPESNMSKRPACDQDVSDDEDNDSDDEPIQRKKKKKVNPNVLDSGDEGSVDDQPIGAVANAALEEAAAEVLPDDCFYKCPNQGCSFRNLEWPNLTRHLNEVHNPNNPFVCELCGQRSKTEAMLETHRQRVHLPTLEELRCDICNEQFQARKQLDDHKGMKHNAVNQPRGKYACGYQGCKATFTQSSKLKRHQNTHEKTQTFQCPIEGCKTVATQQSNLDRHIKNVHEKQKNFLCDACDKAFGSKSDLQRHVDGVHKKKTYSCFFCPTTLQCETSLIRHISEKHKDQKLYPCDVCGQSFGNTKELKTHKLTAHSIGFDRK